MSRAALRRPARGTPKTVFDASALAMVHGVAIGEKSRPR
jgi:hypothetical protein